MSVSQHGYHLYTGHITVQYTCTDTKVCYDSEAVSQPATGSLHFFKTEQGGHQVDVVKVPSRIGK